MKLHHQKILATYLEEKLTLSEENSALAKKFACISASTAFASITECYSTFPLVATIIQMQTNGKGCITHAFSQQQQIGLYHGSNAYLATRLLARSTSFGTFYLFQSAFTEPGITSTFLGALMAACFETTSTNHTLTSTRLKTQYTGKINPEAKAQATRAMFSPHLLKNIANYGFIFPVRFYLSPILQTYCNLHEHNANALATATAAITIQPITSKIDTLQTQHGFDCYKANLEKKPAPSLKESFRNLKNQPNKAARNITGARMALFGLSYFIVDKSMQACNSALSKVF